MTTPVFEELRDYARAQAFRAPESLRFVVGSPRVTARAIELEGTLHNDEGADVEVICFPAYLHLQPLGDAMVAKPPPSGLPRPPPVPPPPVRFVLGPRASHAFAARLALDDYAFTPGSEAEIEWSFTYWNPPLPRGRFRVTLP